MYCMLIRIVHHIIQIVRLCTIGVYAEERAVGIRAGCSAGLLNFICIFPCSDIRSSVSDILTTGSSINLGWLTVCDENDKGRVVVRTLD